MAYTINRRLGELIDSTGQLNDGKIPNDYINGDHIADNTITSSMLHTTFSVPAASLSTISIGDLSDVDITTAAPTSAQVLKWDSVTSKFIPGDAASSIGNLTDVDLTGLANNSVLKYDSIAGEWVVGTNSTAQATANIIRPIALAHITTNNYTANSGTGISWGNYQYSAGNYAYYDFTFAIAQPDANYAVVTDMGIAGDANISPEVSNKTTTGFRVNMYSDSTGSELSVGTVATNELIVLVYGSDPTETIYADSYSSVGDLPDVTITSAADNNILQWNSSTSIWENVAGTTDNIAEGSTNLYYTDARVGSYLTTNSYATQSYVSTAVSNLVDSAPATLDTLNELAAALGDDPNFATTITNSIGTKLPSSSYTAADVLTKITTVDGSGSGLDADLLDGQQGSYYLPTDVARAGISASAWAGGSGYHGYTYSGGNWRFGFSSTSGVVDVYADGNFYATDSSHLVWHAGNDGSGSGLDADLLDGVQGSSYLRSDANDTATGVITFSNTSDAQIILDGQGTTWAGIKWQDVNGLDHIWYNGQNSTFAIGGAGSNVAGKKLHVDGGMSVGSSADATATPTDGIYTEGGIFSAAPITYRLATHASGEAWHDQIHLGRYDFRYTGGNFPNYLPGEAFGIHVNRSSDAAFFGLVSRGANYNDYNCVIAWGDDNPDDILQFRFNNGIKATMNYNGDFTAAGNVTAYSDLRLKENIEVIPNALSKVRQIRGVTFTRNDQDDKEKRHTGVIAQEVELVFPEVVSEDSEGFKNVAYGNMVGLLIEAIKELKAEVDSLKAELAEK